MSLLLRRLILLALLAGSAGAGAASPSAAQADPTAATTTVRIKDIASPTVASGVRLLGYGLVVGLAGTGDSNRTLFTEQTLKNLLEQMGLRVRAESVQVKNVAAVMVTAEAPPFTPAEGRFDVTVSSLGDAASLEGGTLLATPLRGAEGKTYALAQGPVSVGGYGAGGRGAAQVKNHLAVGRVPQGGWVVAPLPQSLRAQQALYLTLRQPDFATAQRIAGRINSALEATLALARDSATVEVRVGESDPAALLARIEDLEVVPDSAARVVINERTGTVVMGERVRILPVAVAHGGLTVRVSQALIISQPPPLSGGETVVVEQPRVQVEEEPGAVLQVPAQATLQELVRALNVLGVKPRDLIAIIQAIKEAGALQAELVVM